MALSFIFGGPGCGKTTELIGRTLKEADKDPAKRVFVIVPEQYTVQMQRDLVLAAERAGILNIDVVSFARLAHRIFEERGDMRRVILDDVGKNLLLQHVLTELKDDLLVLRPGSRKPGYVSEIKSVISEFMQYSIDEDALDEMASGLSAGSGSLYYKLCDMRTVMEAFRQALGSRYMTKEELLTVLAQLVPESGLLDGSVIALDGFTGFTPVQLTLIRELMRVCSEMIVTVGIDPDYDPFAYRNQYELFGMSRRMTKQLTDIAGEASFPVDEPIYLKERKVGTEETLKFLESQAFREKKSAYESDTAPEAVELYLASGPREEVTLAAKKAAELLHSHDWHYRDIAVIVSSMETYGDHVSEIFTRMGLPVFLDYKHPVLDNAFIEYVRSLLEIELNDYEKGSIFRFLRTGISPVNDEETDDLENFVTARGIRGYRRWTQAWEDSEKCDQMRAELMRRLEPVHRALKEAQTVFDYTKALYGFLEEDDAVSGIRSLAERLFARGRSDAVKEYEQIYEALIRLFDQFTELAGDEKVTLSEYAQMLDAGIAEMRIGVIPRTRDYIIAGDLTRTRIPEVKALIIIGAGSAYLPGSLGQTGLLSRWDRERFEMRGYDLAPGAKEKTWSQRYYLGCHLARPTEYLCILCSASDSEGNADEPSYLIREVQEIFPQIPLRPASRYLSSPAGMSETYGIDYLAEHYRQARRAEKHTMWGSLAGWFEESGKSREKIALIRRAGDYHRKRAQLAGEALGRLYPVSYSRSISQLQQYSECPYKHFLTYGLKLREQEIFEIATSDFGNVFHETLELYGRALKEEGLGWDEVDPVRREELIDQALAESAKLYGFGVFEETARGAYRLARLRELAGISISALTAQLAAGTFEPYDFELNFGSGKIDRLDTFEDDDHVYLKVLDYKTGHQKFDLTREYYGLQLQLPVYMHEAMGILSERTGKEAVPGAMFYYEAKDPFVEVKEGQDPAQAVLRDLRVTGAVNSDPAVLDALHADLEGTSDVAPFGYKNDHTLSGNQSRSVYTREQMDTIIRYARYKADRQGERIESGDIRVSPYRTTEGSGCRFCSYKNVCHFDSRMERYRDLEPMKGDEALQKMREDMSE